MDNIPIEILYYTLQYLDIDTILVVWKVNIAWYSAVLAFIRNTHQIWPTVYLNQNGKFKELMIKIGLIIKYYKQYVNMKYPYFQILLQLAPIVNDEQLRMLSDAIAMNKLLLYSLLYKIRSYNNVCVQKMICYAIDSYIINNSEHPTKLGPDLKQSSRPNEVGCFGSQSYTTPADVDNINMRYLSTRYWDFIESEIMSIIENRRNDTIFNQLRPILDKRLIDEMLLDHPNRVLILEKNMDICPMYFTQILSQLTK